MAILKNLIKPSDTYIKMYGSNCLDVKTSQQFARAFNHPLDDEFNTAADLHPEDEDAEFQTAADLLDTVRFRLATI